MTSLRVQQGRRLGQRRLPRKPIWHDLDLRDLVLTPKWVVIRRPPDTWNIITNSPAPPSTTKQGEP